MTAPTTPDMILLCYCSCPDTASAQAIATALVGERLAACVNRLPGISSTYRWQGTVTTDSEELLLIKTTAARFDALKGRLLQLHPYELPEPYRRTGGVRSYRLPGLDTANRRCD